MQRDPVAIARASFMAYVEKDREALEALIADGFHFTSPLDNRLVFRRCWPNSKTIAKGGRPTAATSATPRS